MYKVRTPTAEWKILLEVATNQCYYNVVTRRDLINYEIDILDNYNVWSDTQDDPTSPRLRSAFNWERGNPGDQSQTTTLSTTSLRIYRDLELKHPKSPLQKFEFDIESSDNEEENMMILPMKGGESMELFVGGGRQDPELKLQENEVGTTVQNEQGMYRQVHVQSAEEAMIWGQQTSTPDKALKAFLKERMPHMVIAFLKKAVHKSVNYVEWIDTLRKVEVEELLAEKKLQNRLEELERMVKSLTV
ncbi:hypothetical protein SERLA73DRAFT_150115 [Serpula lacrymans var. lacrymans S7.3]|uniref:Uncharacterized protein n=2 Tax=Serpula lacrymans var. lacrymans TaxID=341189 RepID=F8PIT8_SERL3|nr:uncharacterized protein SERLADRAFT_433894 [Serpula lacrymans var. lacrymans S7.9]EGO04038.1 hypothetical protein SERLA73DRAFT_150115 [Serpula lacrymans var. lacrymans S7.3]EGO29955.1 hypothetical protein SERLADRAFT_433894 [Serpula lacrymans var. lacrymans S7.9]